MDQGTSNAPGDGYIGRRKAIRTKPSVLDQQRNKEREARFKRGLGSKYGDTLWLDISLWEIQFRSARLGSKG